MMMVTAMIEVVMVVVVLQLKGHSHTLLISIVFATNVVITISAHLAM